MDKTEQIFEMLRVIEMILKTDKGLNKYLEKANLHIKEDKLKITTEILNVFSKNRDEQSPLSEIIEVFINVMEDGKIKSNEMIAPVNVIIRNIKNTNVIKYNEFNYNDFAVFIKLMVIILDETNIIDVDNQATVIFNSIDSCMNLIEQITEINENINNNNIDVKNEENKNSHIVDEKILATCLCFNF